MPKMSDRQLSAIVSAKVEAAVGHVGSTVSEERREALRYYRGEPLGTEVENRSQVVSQDVAEAVESMMPSIVEIFASGDKAVQFEPVGPEDEAGAEQATDYCNWIWYNQNPGFQITYTWVKDGLLQKRGIVKIWWEVSEEVTKSRYRGLTQEQIDAIEIDDDVEIVSKEPQGLTVA